MTMKARHTTKADETPEFVEFWNTWRPRMNKNDGRGAARDEFFRHVEQDGADPQDIADGTKWFYHNGGNECENRFRVHAQTWLNRRPYEDGAEMWREYQRRLQEHETRRENVVTMTPAKTGNTKFLRQFEQQKRQA